MTFTRSLLLVGVLVSLPVSTHAYIPIGESFFFREDTPSIPRVLLEGKAETESTLQERVDARKAARLLRWNAQEK